jgi:hypothetical protein
MWRGDGLGDSPPMIQFEKEIEEQGDNWPPLQAGLLGGSSLRATQAKVKLREQIEAVRGH